MPESKEKFEGVYSAVKRVRTFFQKKSVADSFDTVIVRTYKGIPYYGFPRKDIKKEFLIQSGTEENDELGKISYWDIKVGENTAEKAAWMAENPPERLKKLKNILVINWGKMDAWFEEDEEVYTHPHDPHHRIDVLQSSRHIQVKIEGGTVAAESNRPMLLFETKLPVRFYIPKVDFRMDLLVPSDTKTECPYKGIASYYSIKTKNGIIRDAVWYYPFPYPEFSKIQNLLGFYPEKFEEFIVDGDSPDKTPWGVK